MNNYKEFVVPDKVDAKDPRTGTPVREGGRPARYAGGLLVEQEIEGDVIGKVGLLEILQIWVFRQPGWEKGIKKNRCKRAWTKALRDKEEGSRFKIHKEHHKLVVDYLEGDEFIMPEPWGTFAGDMLDMIILDGKDAPDADDQEATA